MKLFYILPVIYLLKIQLIINANPIRATKSKNTQEIHCPQKKTDSDIIKLFPFFVESNPMLPKPSMTYGLMTNGKINSIEIINQKTCIPSIIFCLKNLEKLIINNSYFCDSTKQINGKMEYLPEQIIKLQKLKTLKISHVNLTFLPNIIGNLISLTDLTLSNTNLEYLPETMSYLKSLVEITLIDNPHLRSIKPTDGLPALQILIARHCSIQNLPRYLPKLKDLFMSYNNLTSLSGIETLSNKENKKQNFEFNNNRITAITPEIRHVHTLSRLHLAQNRLDNLPTDMFDMKNLTYLNLQNNTFLPNEKQYLKDEFTKRNSKLKVYFD
ncbi:unnamed protein product [Adineta steineri]|uniref:Uncharacterized protein n=1 Tax=Adineta steineri TaxID=433720 RepID=A0A815CFV4_9BILA|nr:unnamed protein product [Adineta steineri]CAF1538768.1 unnamed protein product [Adineta steineri]